MSATPVYSCLSVLDVVGGSFTSGGGCEVRLRSFTGDGVKIQHVAQARDGAALSFAPLTDTLRVWSPSRRLLLSWSEADKRWLLVDTRSGAVRCATGKKVHGRVWPALGTAWDPEEHRFCFVADAWRNEDDAHDEWKGDGAGEQLDTLDAGLYVMDLRAASLCPARVPDVVLDTALECVMYPALSETDIFFVVVTLSAHEPTGVIFCANRPSRIERRSLAEGQQSGPRALPGCHGMGLAALRYDARSDVLFFVESTSATMHRSPEQLRGIGVASGTRPLSYLTDGPLCLLEPASAVASGALWLTHTRGMQTRLARVDLHTSAVREYAPTSPGESWRLLDVDEVTGDCLAVSSSQLACRVVRVTPAGHQTLVYDNRTVDATASVVAEVVDEGDSLCYALHRRDSSSNLAVLLHGGPHSAASTAWSRQVDAFLRDANHSVLVINYVGSLGVPHMDRLPGAIGEVDVHSCLANLQHALQRHNFARVSLCGGSHGGFLAAHLSLLAPRFACAVLRNPVIDLPAMLATSDIPDWVRVEGGSTDPAVLSHKSPLGRLQADTTLVPCPTLLLLGDNDRRVPWSQGKAWFYALRARGAVVKCERYAGDNHSLTATPRVEVRNLVASIEWLRTHAEDPAKQ